MPGIKNEDLVTSPCSDYRLKKKGEVRYKKPTALLALCYIVANI